MTKYLKEGMNLNNHIVINIDEYLNGIETLVRQLCEIETCVGWGLLGIMK